MKYISKNKYHYWQLKHQHLASNCYINEFVQELLDKISIFFYDAQLSVNVITVEPLLAGNN